MLFRNTDRVRPYLFILFAIAAFPFSLFAEQKRTPVEYESGFYYTVQKGDTLWDLSDRFYNSPWMWPDLWRNNDRISNPHALEPGIRIRLFQRIDTAGPAGAEPETPPEIKMPKIKIFYLYTEIDKIGFVRKTPADAWGAIFKVEDDKVIISKDDLIYITPAGKARFTPGDRFKIYRTLADPVNDPKTGGVIGIQHYVVGIAEIIEHESRFPLARITHSFREIKLNDSLIPHQPESPEIIVTVSVANMEGRVIGFEERNRLIGSQSLAFIDKGKNDGLARGQIYSLYLQGMAKVHPKSREYAPLKRFDFGSFLVLHTEPTTSTVLVTMAKREISKGSKFGSPAP